MRIFASALCFALVAAMPAGAGPDGCDALKAAIGGIEGFDLSVPPAGMSDGGCVLDGALLRGNRPGLPNLSADRMRLRGEGTPLTRLEVDAAGLRLAPRPGDDALDAEWWSLFRLQRADLQLSVTQDAAAGTVVLDGLSLRLSGGSELELSADLLAADLTMAALALGRVTRLQLDWRNDGRLLRPILERTGRALSGATGEQAVEAARTALAGLVAALPDAALSSGSEAALERLVAALPQGRGSLRLVLSFPDGIGAAQLGLAALSDDPLGQDALARLFKGATITADWQPGIAP